MRPAAGAPAPRGLSHPVGTFRLVQLSLDDEYLCIHCGTGFPRRRHRGRKPQYCSPSCRQRSYEARRRGAFEAGLPVVPVVPRLGGPRTPRYEAGFSTHRVHALRTEGVADRRGFRPTLCGAWAGPIRHLFLEHRDDRSTTCATCLAVVERYPPPHRPDPVRELPALRAVLRRDRADELAQACR